MALFVITSCNKPVLLSFEEASAALEYFYGKSSNQEKYPETAKFIAKHSIEKAGGTKIIEEETLKQYRDKEGNCYFESIKYMNQDGLEITKKEYVYIMNTPGYSYQVGFYDYTCYYESKIIGEAQDASIKLKGDVDYVLNMVNSQSSADSLSTEEIYYSMHALIYYVIDYLGISGDYLSAKKQDKKYIFTIDNTTGYFTATFDGDYFTSFKANNSREAFEAEFGTYSSTIKFKNPNSYLDVYAFSNIS